MLILFVQLGKTSTRSTITITPKEFYTYYAYTLIVPVLPRQELQPRAPTAVLLMSTEADKGPILKKTAK